MKILISSLIVLILLVFAYTQLISEDIPPANSEPKETHSATPALSNESSQTPVSPFLQEGPVITQIAHNAPETDKGAELLDPHTQQINYAYDAFDAEMTRLFELVSAESLNLAECRYLYEETWNLQKDSELSVLLGDDTISFKNYREYDLEYLHELALLDDLAAQKMLGFKLMRSLQTLEEGIYWSKVAAARGSKHAIVHIIHAYLNDLSITPGSKETKKAPDYEEKYEVYVALSQYRAGVPRYLPEERDSYKDDAIAQQYFALLDEILAIRQSYELPEFVNRTTKGMPEDIRTLCNEIENEDPQPWTVVDD